MLCRNLHVPVRYLQPIELTKWAQICRDELGLGVAGVTTLVDDGLFGAGVTAGTVAGEPLPLFLGRLGLPDGVTAAGVGAAAGWSVRR